MRRGGRKAKEYRKLANTSGVGLVEDVYDILSPERDSIGRATSLAEGFHGRPHRDITDIIEEIQYPEHLAKIGDLTQLQVITVDGRAVVPLKFAKDVEVAFTTDKQQIIFLGGDQSLDLDQAISQLGLDETQRGKHLVRLGPCYTISYYTDKHHLEGPRYQKSGCEYIHHFGEEGGEMPDLVYDTINQRLLLVGGSYDVVDEGIRN